MNFGQMQAKVRRKTNELTDVFFSDGDVIDAINEAYQEIADATEFYEREAMVPLLKWRTYYDLSRILPDEFLSPRRVYNPRTSRWLDPVDTRILDYHTTVQWELTLGEPEQYLMRGNWWLGVFPRPTKDSEGLRFYYTAIPAKMCHDTDEPDGLPREFHEGLVAGAISNLLAQERETKKAIQYWSDYSTYTDRLKSFVEGRTALAGAPRV